MDNVVNISLPYWVYVFIAAIVAFMIYKLITRIIEVILKFMLMWKHGYPEDGFGDTNYNFDFNLFSNNQLKKEKKSGEVSAIRFAPKVDKWAEEEGKEERNG